MFLLPADKIYFQKDQYRLHVWMSNLFIVVGISVYLGVPWWQPHRRSGLATLPSVGAVP